MRKLLIGLFIAGSFTANFAKADYIQCRTINEDGNYSFAVSFNSLEVNSDKGLVQVSREGTNGSWFFYDQSWTSISSKLDNEQLEVSINHNPTEYDKYHLVGIKASAVEIDPEIAKFWYKGKLKFIKKNFFGSEKEQFVDIQCFAAYGDIHISE